MFRINVINRLLFFVSAAIVLTAAGGFAQNNDYYIQLTRISMIEGNVGYQRVPDEEWAAAGVNMPLEPGDRIYTGRGGRAEIEFEEGSVLRLAENTDIEILTLDEDFVQIRMLLGIASITVEGGVDFEISAPAAAFSTEANGIYRFEVMEDGRSDAIVRKGRLEAVNDRFTRVIRNGDLIHVYPNTANPVITNHNRRDAWDEWTDRRDADRLTTSASRSYIPPGVSIGVTELDRHGRWVYVTNYGWGWTPSSVTVGWSPYSVGRWVYRPRFGWTWVSYETWGWLPYHYGRWYRDARFVWTWFPGQSVSFRFWSPGLVVFYRGSGWVSWGPLGPGDYYDVSYYRYRRIHAGDLIRMRALAVRQPGNYINQNVRGAFQTVNLDHFRGVNSGGQNLNARRNDISQPWRQGNLIRGGLDVSPTRESFRPAPDRRGERPQTEVNRTVVVRRTPSQASAGDDRLRQVNNPRVSPTPDRTNVDRGNNSGAGSAADRRPNETRPGSPNVSIGNSSGNRDRQPASDQRTRPAPGAPAVRQDNSGASSQNPAGENRDRSTVSRPSVPQGNRQTERPNTDASPPTRENSRSTTGGSSTGNRDRQAAPSENSRPAPEAPATRRNNPNTSSQSPAGENRDRAIASPPAAARENRQPERPNTGAASPSTRENRSATSGNLSVGRDRQAAPAQGNQPSLAAPSARQNNPGASIRNSPPVQGAPRIGQQNQAPASRNARPETNNPRSGR